MLDKIYKLKDSVDVFIDDSQGSSSLLVQFYKINTRESVYIETSQHIVSFVSQLDGVRSLGEIISNGGFDENDAFAFIDFLLRHGIAIENLAISEDERFLRQIAYFDDLSVGISGNASQEIIGSKSVVIFGVGSVGSNIAILLARMGFKKFVLVDYKRIDKSHIVRHTYVDNYNIGELKVSALKDYLLKIDSHVDIQAVNCKILPHSDLDALIPDNTDVIINTADEPYIGHISIKIGRYAWSKNIAFYVAGGFDAHSMSTGEMIIPNITPCIDCYSNSFKIALKDYKPVYITNEMLQEKTENKKNIENSLIFGGAGSIASCSLFSASYAVMRIVYYFLNVECEYTKRGEYLMDRGEISWIQLERHNKECGVCGRK